MLWINSYVLAQRTCLINAHALVHFITLFIVTGTIHLDVSINWEHLLLQTTDQTHPDPNTWLFHVPMSKHRLLRHTYLGRTGTEVELVTVCMLVVVAVAEALFCMGQQSCVLGTFPIRYQIPMLFSSLWGNAQLG